MVVLVSNTKSAAPEPVVRSPIKYALGVAPLPFSKTIVELGPAEYTSPIIIGEATDDAVMLPVTAISPPCRIKSAPVASIKSPVNVPPVNCKYPLKSGGV